MKCVIVLQKPEPNGYHWCNILEQYHSYGCCIVLEVVQVDTHSSNKICIELDSRKANHMMMNLFNSIPLLFSDILFCIEHLLLRQ